MGPRFKSPKFGLNHAKLARFLSWSKDSVHFRRDLGPCGRYHRLESFAHAGLHLERPIHESKRSGDGGAMSEVRVDLAGAGGGTAAVWLRHLAGGRGTR